MCVKGRALKAGVTRRCFCSVTGPGALPFPCTLNFPAGNLSGCSSWHGTERCCCVQRCQKNRARGAVEGGRRGKHKGSVSQVPVCCLCACHSSSSSWEGRAEPQPELCCCPWHAQRGKSALSSSSTGEGTRARLSSSRDSSSSPWAALAEGEHPKNTWRGSGAQGEVIKEGPSPCSCPGLLKNYLILKKPFNS